MCVQTSVRQVRCQVWKDCPARGLLPLLEYPEDAVREYIEAHAEDGLKLTPTVAHQYPGLVRKSGVYDW